MVSTNNVVLIGMPAVGKSTVGVLLAKATRRDFIDTDVRIQAQEGRRLQDIINNDGAAVFRRIEEGVVVALRCVSTVVSTGGSVVYSPRSMEHLRTVGPILHLDLPLAQLRERLRDFESRGLVRSRHQTLDDLYAERDPLYRRYADLSVDCSGKGHEAAVEAIVAALVTLQR